MTAHRGARSPRPPTREGTPTSRTRRRASALGGAVVLGVVLAFVGTDAVPVGVRSLDAATLGAGVGLAAVTTAFAAWRWAVVARRLGVPLTLPAGFLACYRAQFLNMTLPGGILGDLGRGIGHGRAVADVGRGLRAVAWERTIGQVVLAAATLCALALTEPTGMPWPPTPWWAAAASAVLGGGVAAALVARRAGRRTRRMARTLADDARALAAPRVACQVGVASLVVLAGHLATFALAARAVGARLDGAQLLEVSLVVLLVGALPLNVAGWGPREGAAAGAFAAAGQDPSTGLAVSVAYGTIALVAAAPGAAVLAVGVVRGWRGAADPRSRGAAQPAPTLRASALRGGATDG